MGETKKKERGKVILIFVLLSLSLLPLVASANIGISPASANFTNVMRGGYSERWVTISTDSPTEVEVTLEPFGEIAEWIFFDEESFKLSKSEPYHLKTYIVPPEDMPNGIYSGFLRFSSSAFGESQEGYAVGRIKPSLDLRMDVEVTDAELVSCGVSGLTAFSAEQGDDLIIEAKIANHGNVRIYPTILVEIWDQDQVSILKKEDFTDEEILPTVQNEIQLRIDSSDLELGQYWGDVSFLECYVTQTVTFDVLEEGALSSTGSLLNILALKEVGVGETNPITANFKNTGEKEIEAQFKGKITYNGKIVNLLESEKILVPISKVETFSFYFTPQKKGRYVISGRVFYGNKKTFESSVSFDAFSGKFNYWYLAYVLFLLIIVFLIYKIRKERKIYLSKLRMVKK